MIRSVKQALACDKKYKSVEKCIADLRKQLSLTPKLYSGVANPEYSTLFMMLLEQEEVLSRLQQEQAHYSCLSDCFVVGETPQYNTTKLASQSVISDLGAMLAGVRISAGYDTQERFANATGKTQGLVAKMESPDKQNWETQGLEEWAAACNKQFRCYFSAPMPTIPAAATIHLVAIESAILRSQYYSKPLVIPGIFLQLLMSAFSADAVSCYVSNRYSRRLKLLHHTGSRYPDKISTHVRRHESPSMLLRHPAACFSDLKASTTLTRSSYCEREEIKSSITVPFSNGDTKGIIFINYRREMDFPPELEVTLPMLQHVAAAMLYDQIQVSKASVQASPIGDVSSNPVSELASSLVAEKPRTRNARTSLHDKLETLILKPLGLPTATCLLLSIDRATSTHSIACQIDGQHAFYPSTSSFGPRINLCRTTDVIGPGSTSHELVLKSFKSGAKTVEPTGALLVPLPSDTDDYADYSIAVIWNDSALPSSLAGDYGWLLDAGRHVVRWHQAREILRRRLSSDARGGKDSRAHSLKKLLARMAMESPRSLGLQSTAELIRLMWHAASVDIWPYCWQTHGFSINDGVSAFDKSWLDAVEHSLESAKQKLAPRSDGSGLSERLVKSQSRAVFACRRTSDEKYVASNTKDLGIKAIIGAPIFGPDAVRSDGVIWARFNETPSPAAFASMQMEMQVFSGFCHLITNPFYYGMGDASQTLDESESVCS